MGKSHDSNFTNNGLKIRNARSNELTQVSLLLRDAYQQYQNSFPPVAWRFYLEDIMDVRSRLNASELVIAELNGRLVGAVTLYLDGAHSQQSWPENWAGIRLLAVHPKYRGLGIGHALMEECIRRCRARGITTIGLHTTRIMDIARDMYERMGFVRVPEFDFHPAPEHVVMAYRLDLRNSNSR
ncbi:MAG: GNAT family N-acetyltransferase [Chloroflexi bacterium]|nr:GNAT family N-acetyltransferase [Chloroflexota bacterium]